MSDQDHISKELSHLRADMRQLAVVESELTAKCNRLAQEFNETNKKRYEAERALDALKQRAVDLALSAFEGMRREHLSCEAAELERRKRWEANR